MSDIENGQCRLIHTAVNRTALDSLLVNVHSFELKRNVQRNLDLMSYWLEMFPVYT